MFNVFFVEDDIPFLPFHFLLVDTVCWLSRLRVRERAGSGLRGAGGSPLPALTDPAWSGDQAVEVAELRDVS